MANKQTGNKAGPGRPKGSPNKTTAKLKDAILLAAEQSGRDKDGKGGLVGYLRRVADEDVKSFSTLLGKVLPIQVAGDADSPIVTVNKIELIALPSHDDSES